MKNLKVGTKILLSFCLILAMVVALTIAVSLSSVRVVSDVEAVAVNNMFTIAAKDLLDKFSAARAAADVFFTYGSDMRYHNTVLAIEHTKSALQRLKDMTETYPLHLSVYAYELDDIGDSIQDYIEAVENVNVKRIRQDELRLHLVYSSKLLNRMFQQMYEAQFNKLHFTANEQYNALMTTEGGGEGIDLSENVNQLTLIMSLSEDFEGISDKMTPLLYQNDLSGFEEFMAQLDEYTQNMISTLKEKGDITTRSISTKSQSNAQLYQEALSEYYESALTSVGSIESASRAQQDLQYKTAELLASLESASRTRIGETKNSAALVFRLMLFGSIVAVATGLILTFLISRSITQPVEKMVAAARRLAMGDLNLELDVSSNDEVGRLALQMREMIVSVKEREKALNFKSEHDLLTGLFNKVTTMHLINQFLVDELSNDGKDAHALFFIDLDNFKPVNDILGHDYGDKVLCEFAERLRTFFRANDIIGRVGGDEFVVLMKRVPSEEFAEKKAAEACAALRKTHHEKDRDFPVTTSIGVCFFSAHGDSYEELYKKADSAMYLAKRGGKDSYHVCKSI